MLQEATNSDAACLFAKCHYSITSWAQKIKCQLRTATTKRAGPSGVGGVMFGLGWLHGIGFVGLAFAAAAIAVWSATRDR